MMRNLILVLVLALAAGGLYLLLGTDDASNDGGDPSVVDDGGAGEERTGPGLRGTGLGPAVVVEGLATGRGSISGFAKRGGMNVPARVEIRQMMTFGENGMFSVFEGGGTRIFDVMLGDGVGGRAQATSETDGVDRFHFGSLPAGMYVLRAFDEDGRTATQTVGLPADGARVSKDIELPEGDQTLEGRVVFADGKPFRGTVVLAIMGGERMMSMFGPVTGTPVQTDARGAYRVAGLVQGSYTVTALLPGQLRVTDGPVAVPHPGVHELTVPTGENKASGQVLDAETEKPIPGARVLAGGGEPGEGLFMISSTTADEEGRFEIATPGGRSGGVLASHPGYGVGLVNLRGGATEGLQVMLSRTGSIQGTVSGPDGKAVPAGVRVMAMGGGRGFMPVMVTALTDKDGRYFVEGVPAGKAMLFAQGKGFASGMRRGAGGEATVTSGETTDFDLTVAEAGIIEGTVLDPAGKPIVGAVVGSSSAGSDNDFLMMFAMAGAGGQTPPNAVVSGPGGSYRIDSVAAGDKQYVIAQAALQAPYRSEPLGLEAGQTIRHDVRFEEARWLDLQVVGRGGRGVSGATLVAGSRPSEQERWRPITMQPYQTDAEGRVRVGPLPRGQIALRVQAPGHVTNRDWQIVEGAAESKGTFSHRLTLQPGRIVAGIVEIPDGVPHAKVRVDVRKNHQGDGPWYSESRTVDAEGAFRFDDLPEGDFFVSVDIRHDGRRFKIETEVTPDDERMRLVPKELEGGAQNLVIEIVNAEGKAIPGGRIRVILETKGGGTSSMGTNFSAGRHFQELDEVPDTVRIEVMEMGPKYAATQVGPMAPPADGKIRIEVGAGVSIAGVAAAPDGTPIQGLEIEATPLQPDGKLGDRAAAEARSRKDGSFELKGLGAGRYRLSASPKGRYLMPKDPVEVTGGTQDLRLTMREGVVARITIEDPKGKGLSGMWVTASPQHPDKDLDWSIKWRWQRQHQREGRTDGSGVLVLEGLDPDYAYDLRVSVSEERGLRGKSLEKWKPADTTIQLEAAFTVNGQVVVSGGGDMPLQGSSVYWRPAGAEDKGWSGVEVDQEGRFELSGLPEGDIDIYWQAPNSLGRMRPGGRQAPKPIRVKAGDQDVILRAEAGRVVVLEIPQGVKLPDYLNIQVLGTSEQGTTSTNVTSRRGKKVLLTGLEEGVEYLALALSLPNGEYLQGKFTANSGTASLAVEKGRSLAGTVRLEGGASPGEAVGVMLQRKDFHLHQWVRTDAEGNFRIDGLPDGTWVVRVNARLEDKRYDGQVEAQSGDESIRVILKAR